MDSTVLLNTCARVRKQGGFRFADFKLAAVHVDHGLQPGSDAWAVHCRAHCDALGIPLEIRRLGLRLERGQSLEALAREVRYAVFRELLEPGDALATAQHRNDQAETLLLALLRGSGPAGLAGMGAQGRLGPGWLLRPFLDLPRATMEAEAKRLALNWVEDPSNTCLDRERNRLRHRVLPLLVAPPSQPECKGVGDSEADPKAAFRGGPDPSLMLSRSAAHCAEAQLLLDEFADELIEDLPGTRAQTLSIQGLLRFLQADPRSSGRSRLRLVLRRWIRRRGFLAPSEPVLERLIGDLLMARPDRDPLVSWRGCEARRYRDDLYLMRPRPNPPSAVLHWDGRCPLELPLPFGRVSLSRPGGERLGGESGILFDTQSRRLDPVQTVQGFHRSLKKLYQEAGIPAWLRPLTPLLVRDREILAIPGLFRHPSLAMGELRWQGHPWEAFGLFVAPGAPKHERP